MKLQPPLVVQRKSWKDVKKFLTEEIEQEAPRVLRNEEDLETYIRTGEIVYVSPVNGELETVTRPARSNYLRSPLYMVGYGRFIDGCRLAPAAQAQSSLAAAVLYAETKSVLNFLVESEFPAKFGRNLRGFSIDHASWIGLAAGVGAMEVVERWAPLVVQALQNGYVPETKYEGMNHFILRLWCAARGRDYPQTGYPLYDVAEGVLAKWDTPDTETLGQWLVQLCNLHTKLTGSADFMDFANQFSHYPVEVMMLFRLREQRGLNNPLVDHPLMKFSWSRVWPVRVAQPDDLLARVHRRLEQDEGITVEGLYRQFAAG